MERTTRHLHDAVQAVDTIEDAALHRNADDGERSVRSCHTREMSSTTSGSNDDLDSARRSLGRILGHVVGCAVSGGDFDLRLKAEVVAQELETWDQSLQVTVRAHNDTDGGGGLGGTGWCGLSLDIGALGAHVVNDIDQRLDQGLGLVHGGCSDGDVAHLAAGFGITLAVEVDGGVGDGEGGLGGLQVRVGGCTADDVKHDRRLEELETLGGNGKVENGTDVAVELGQSTALHGPVAGVVDSACELAEHQAVVLKKEHLDTESTLALECRDSFPGEGLRLLIDGVRDVAGWSVHRLANGVLLDCLDGGVGENIILCLNDHDGEFLIKITLENNGVDIERRELTILK